MQWPRNAIPENPHAWLTQVAFRKMTDRIRSKSARRRRETEVVEEASRVSETGFNVAPVEDDALILLLLCCHPALRGHYTKRQKSYASSPGLSAANSREEHLFVPMQRGEWMLQRTAS